MLPSSFLPAIVAPFLFASQATCAVSTREAINLFNGLKRQAEQVRTAAFNLKDLACLGNGGYTALAKQVDQLTSGVDYVTYALDDSRQLSDDDSDAKAIFDAYYDYSLVLRRFLAALATKSCLPLGLICAILPTTARDAIKQAVTTLRGSTKELADAFEDYMPDDYAEAIDGISETDLLFCDVVIGSFGGIVPGK